jgi:hypothetical protein
VDAAPPSGVDGIYSASGLVDLAVNDYLAVVVIQTSGGALNLGTDSHFEMVRVA